MESVQSPRSAHPHLPWLIGLGVIVIAGAAGYAAWANGMFKTKEKVAIVVWTEDPFWEPMQKGAADAAQAFDVDLQFITSKADVDSQNGHIKDALASGIKGLGIAPNNPKAQEAVINDAADKVIVVTLDSDAPNTKRRGFVGTDDYVAGQVAAGEVRAAIPDGGKVIVSVGSVDMSNGSDRRRGLIDNLMDRPFNRTSPGDPIDKELKGSAYTVSATVTDNDDLATAVKNLTAALKTHPDTKCIVGLFSINGPAAVKAIDAAGLTGKVKVVGFDESAEEQAAVQAGTVYSSVLQNQYRCGYETVRVLSEMIHGVKEHGPTDSRLTELPVTVMRPDNIDILRQTHVIRDVAGATATTQPTS